MQPEDITVEVRSDAFGRIGTVDPDFITDLKMVKRFNNVGSWTMSLPTEAPMASQLAQKGRGIVVSGPVGLTDYEPAVPPTYGLGASLINLCTNPQFDTSAGAIEIWRNQATNPSFEAFSGTTEVRRNQVTNPKAISGGSGWGANSAGGASTQTYLTGSGLPSPLPTEYTRMAWTSAALGAGGGRTMPTTVALSVGVHQVSMYVRTSLAQNVRISSQGGTWLGSFTSQPVVTTVANTWVLVTGFVNVTTSGTFIGYVEAASGGHNWAIGETLDTTGGMIVSTTGTVSVPYFDGTVSQDSDLTASWTGTAHASASILSGGTVTSTVHGQNRGISSTQWASSGARSLRQIPWGTNGSNSRIAGDAASLSGSGVTFVAGRTYTVKAKLRLLAPQTGTLNGEARRVTVSYNGTGGTVVRSTQAANAGGVSDHVVRFTIPADATYCDVLVWNGAPNGGGDTWWDDIMVVEGQYTGGFFDGSAPVKVRRNLAWDPRATSLSGIDGKGMVTQRWYGGGSNAGNTTLVASGGPSDGPASFKRKTWTVVSAANVQDVAFSFVTGVGAAAFPVTAGQTWTFSYWYRTSWAAAGTNNEIVVTYYDAAGVSMGNSSGPLQAFPAANVWTRISRTLTIPAGAASMQIWHNFYSVASPPSVGSTLDGTGLLAELSGSLGTYFDGFSSFAAMYPYSSSWEGAPNASMSYLYDADLTQVWTGTANASASVLNGQRPTTTSINQDSTPPGVGYTKSYRHLNVDGTYSLRWVRDALDTDSTYRILSLSSGIFNGLAAGTSVTVKLRVFSQTAINLMVGILNPSGIGPGANQTKAVPAGVWTDLTFVYVLSIAGDASHHIYVTTPGAGTIVDFDYQFAVAENYTGGYFDGYTPDDSYPGYAYSWSGTANGSTSVRNVITITDPGSPPIEPQVTYGILFSGPVTEFTKVTTSEDSTGTWFFTGVDDNIHSADGNAWPEPSNDDPTTQTEAYDVRTGAAETLLRGYMADNLVDGVAPPSRAITGLTLAGGDLARGGTVTARARFTQMGKVLSDIATLGGLGFDIVQENAGLKFYVYEPQDKSSTVRMDIANDMLSKTEYGFGAPTATRVIVAGQGEGVDRQFIAVTTPEAGDEELAWGRKIESFKDRRDTGDPLELEQDGLLLVTENGKTITSLSVVPNSQETMQYSIDWRLGDIVAIVIGDEELVATVTEAVIAVGAQGVLTAATIGAPVGFDFESKIAQQQSEQGSRIAALERSSENNGISPSVAATPDTLVLRDGNGRAKVAEPAVDGDIANKIYVDNKFLIPAIPGAVDLNTYLTSGDFIQTTNANATLALNYPVDGKAGLLEVFTYLGHTYQRYTLRDDRIQYNRRWDVVAGTWTSWLRQINAADFSDTGWLPLPFNSGYQTFSAPATTYECSYRVVNIAGMIKVSLKGLVERIAGSMAANTAYTPVFTMPVDARPTKNSYFPMGTSTSTTGAALFVSPTTGVTEIRVHTVALTWVSLDGIEYWAN